MEYTLSENFIYIDGNKISKEVKGMSKTSKDNYNDTFKYLVNLQDVSIMSVLICYIVATEGL